MFDPLSPRQELISECEGLGLDGKAPNDWRETYSEEQLKSAIAWLDEVGTVADQLIAAAATSPHLEDWISAQLTAGHKPSQILATMGQGGLDRVCAALANVNTRLALASAFTFALTFVGVAAGLRL